jgi:hypothetical protein
MNSTRILGAAALALLVALSSCGNAPAADQTQQAAQQQFLTERNGTSSPAASGPTDAQNPPIFGEVEQLDGQKLVVKNPIDQTSTTVQLAATAKIYKQVMATRSEIKPGDQLRAFGSQQNAVFAAEGVEFGALMPGNGGGMVMRHMNGVPPAGATGDHVLQQALGGPAAPAGGPPLPGADKQALLAAEPASGTVTQVAGNTITIKAADGQSITVQLSDTAEIGKWETTQAEAIERGKMILATVVRNGSLIEASQVQILRDLPQP